MAGIKTKILAGLIILLLTVVLGLYTGIKNNSDYQITEFQFDEISEEVRVYRDENFVPTIIAQNEYDLFFAQGYEMSRDRLWQLEFFRSVANGELSRLFGEDLVDSDKYLKQLSLKYAAEKSEARTDEEYLDVVQAFIDGVNKYIELHENNLPTEFTILGVKPKKWTITDSFAIQGVLSRTLSLAGMDREIFRNKVATEFGPEKGLELYDILDPVAREYYLSLNASDLAPVSQESVDLVSILELSDPKAFDGSNSWVVSADKAEGDYPIFANDPHLSLSTPGIWWPVHLYAPTLHVQGFTFAGVPGIVLGHNDHIAWGATNTGQDATDLFYFDTNDEDQYWHDGQWKDFTEITHTIEVAGEDSQEYTVKYTEYGPVLDPDLYDIPDSEDKVWTLRWTLFEDYEQNQIIKAVLDYNRATNTAEFVEALRYFGVPSQNIVFATVDGDIGYQFTGVTPIRKVPGSGVIPQNGSDSRFGWNGTIAYEDQLRVINPDKDFYSTANEKIDTRDNFYITDQYALPYRGNQIKKLLTKNQTVSIEDIKTIQDDTTNLYAELVLNNTLSVIKAGSFSEDMEDKVNEAIGILDDWNLRMDRVEKGATIWALYRIFLEEQTFSDELDSTETLDYDAYDSRADYGISGIITNSSSTWFDDVDTDIVEDRDDIVVRAFEMAITYLVDEIGRNSRNWDYGNVHEVVFEHPMGEVLGLFHEGKTPSDGSEHTVKAAGGTPSWDDGEVNFVQTHGSSMRFIAETSPEWENVFAIAPPGQSEHFFSQHRGDNVGDWIEGTTPRWSYTTTFNKQPDFTYLT